MLESGSELRGEDGSLLPGYGWVFGVGDGTSNVGLGILNTTNAWQKTDYKDLLTRWTGGMPSAWQFDDEHATGPVRGGALPMGFNRTPHYRDGVLLVGDAGGAVNPSTARASPTPWSRGCSPRRWPCRRSPARPARPGSGRSRTTRCR
jgi:flavin-dependent dehydrogenase